LLQSSAASVIASERVGVPLYDLTKLFDYSLQMHGQSSIR